MAVGEEDAGDFARDFFRAVKIAGHEKAGGTLEVDFFDGVIGALDLAMDDGVQEYPYAEPPFWDFGDGPTSFRPSPTVHFRFNGQAIVGWCDGHVSLERKEKRDVGENPYGGDPDAHQLGWFGPDEENGYWNPNRAP